MTKTYCDVLGSQKIWQIAYNACYSLRAGKAGDAQPECSAYASAVVDAVCKREIGDVPDLESICCEHVKDPWGSDIGLGWLGQLIAADSNCSTDCPRIATNTKAAIGAAALGVESADDFGESNNDAIERVIEMQVKMQMLNVVMNMFRPNPYAQLMKAMQSMLQPMMYIMMISALTSMLSTVE